MSKKEKSDILSGMGSGFQIIKALRDAGATDDQLRAIIANGSAFPGQIVTLLKGVSESQSGEIFRTVTVDHTRTLADMIKAGKYDYANSDIVEKNFPIQRPDVIGAVAGGGPFRTQGVQYTNTDLVLVHLNKVATTAEVLAHMDKLGLRPARIEELLALGEKYPNIQRDYPLVALGSVWLHSSGGRHVPDLYRHGSERVLSLYWDDTGRAWRDVCRFVAVSK